MSNENNELDNLELDPELAEILPDELTSLKQRADLLGISYPANVTLKTLKAKVLAAQKQTEHEVEATDQDTALISQSSELQKMRDENLALVRVIIAPMCPTKRELQGDIFSVSNSVLGTVKKYIPYNVEWHVPVFLLKMLKRKKLQTFVTIKDAQGRPTRKPRIVPAFQITELPPLTPDELEALKKSQALRQAAEV